jgi:hypothetical protein
VQYYWNQLDVVPAEDIPRVYDSLNGAIEIRDGYQRWANDPRRSSRF